MAEAQRLHGSVPPALDQLAFAGLLRGGHIDRHLRRVRGGYRRRRDLLVAALDDLGPSFVPTGIAAGLHLVVRLTDVSKADVRSLAKERGIALAFLSDHRHHRRAAEDGLVLGYARQPPAAFPGAVAELVALLRDATRDARRSSTSRTTLC